jgi:hypothetical protein
MTIYRVQSYLHINEGVCVTFFRCHWHHLLTDGYCCWFHPLLDPHSLGGTRRNGIMSLLQISSLLLSWTLLFVWSVWTTSFEHPLFGVKLEVILSWLPQSFPLRRLVQHLFNTAFLQSFILHDWDGLCCLLRILSQDQKFRLVLCLSHCSWSGMGTTAMLGITIPLFVEKR